MNVMQRSVVLIWSVILISSSSLALPKLRVYSSMIPDNKRTLLAKSFGFLCDMRPNQVTQQEWSEIVQDSILKHLLRPGEVKQDKLIKRITTETMVNSVISICNDKEALRQTKQTDNQDIYDGVENVLRNVFSGNLVGVIQSSVGIRAPENVSNAVSNVLRILLGNISSARESVRSGTSNGLSVSELSDNVGQGGLDEAGSSNNVGSSGSSSNLN